MGASPRCLLLATALAACVSAADDRAGTTPAAAGGSVTVLYIGDERLWHPSMSVSAHHLLFLRLFRWNEQGQPEGELVRTWEASDDGRTWTYHLRTDVRWHDGVPVTAHDVAFTHAFLSNPKAAFPWDISGRVVTVIDDSTLTIRYDRPGWPDPMDSWLVYYPRHLLEDLDPALNYEWDFWTAPVGNGPYRYVRHIPKTMVELERNPDYPGPPAAIERVILRLGSANARLELQSGNADIAGLKAITVRDAFRLAEDDDRFRVYYTRDDRSYVLHWNLTHPIFADRRVRRGLTFALDRAVFARVLDLPPELAFIDVPTPNAMTEAWLPGAPPTPMAYDPDRADSLLAAAGWVDADGDGIRERDGRPLAFGVLVDGEASRLAVLLQSQLRAVGADVRIETLATGLLRVRLREGDFESTIRTSRYGYLLEDLRRADTASWGSRPAFIGLHHLGLIAVATALDTAFGAAPRQRLHERFWSYWQDEVPATYLANNVLLNVAHRRVRGLASPYRAFATTHMRELWVEDEP